VEEKKETEAQSCFDRIWYSLNCSARFDRVIMAPTLSLKRCRFYLLELEGRPRRRQQRLGRVNDDYERWNATE
jgi:hypothetical protein